MQDKIAVVGETICGGRHDALSSDGNTLFLRGYNTFSGSAPNNEALLVDGAGEIVSAVSGRVEVTGRVVSVKGRSPRYLPEIGDVVVGRIVEVSGNRWLVDVNSTQFGVMLLSNVTEPGGMLRRRGRGDELGMRHLFDQSDIIAAEVQRVTPDGVVSLHTRAADKYGKLSTGHLVSISPSLVKRAKHQFVSFPKYLCRVVMGVNGNIWVSPSDGVSGNDAECRHNTARVCNCIKLLAMTGKQVSEKSIEAAVDASLEYGIGSFDVLNPRFREQICNKV